MAAASSPADPDEDEASQSSSSGADAKPQDDVRETRDKDYSGQSRHADMLAALYTAVVNAFEDKSDQIESLNRYWSIYNCELGENQAYAGNAQIYLPLIKDAIEARVTRYTNVLFPENGQHVDVISYPGDIPHGLMALLNQYVRSSRLRHLTPALLRNGEVEGHYAAYVDWQETERYVTKKVVKPVTVDGMALPDQDYTDVEDDTIVDAHPAVRIIGLADIAVIPPTADGVEVDAEIVACIWRMSKGAIEAARRDGLFTVKAAKDLCDQFGVGDDGGAANTGQQQSTAERQLWAAGVKEKGKYALVYEVWKRVEIKGKRRWCRIFFGGEKLCLGFKVNPNWNDRCSIMSVPRTKVAGSHYGKSPVDAVEQLQYQANDAANMGMDSAQYSLMPIVTTDPTKNPNYASMVLSMAAVWQTSPDDTKLLTFPPLWKDALEIVAACKSQIMQSFGLNPAMMPQGVAASKPTQAQVAQEQAVAIEGTANELTTLEEALFSPLLERFFELDQQHRDQALTVKIYGQMGIDAQMEQVPPFAWDQRYDFRWRGVEVFRSQQQNQAMIAAMNVLRSLPPVLPSGMRIDIDPIIETLVENVFGPRLGSRILVDQRDQLSVDPALENELLAGGVDMPTHFLDDDAAHLQAHVAFVKQSGDPLGLLRAHAMKHAQQLQQKGQGGGAPGGQGGEPGQPGPTAAAAPGQMAPHQGVPPGVAGTPRPGAVPIAPSGGQGPAGMIHSDQVSDPARMPRKALN